MKKYIITCVMFSFLLSCKPPEIISAISSPSQGVVKGTKDYTFKLILKGNHKDIKECTKVWYHQVCYEVKSQNFRIHKRKKQLALTCPAPPRGFRSSKSPIKTTKEDAIVVEYKNKKDEVKHLVFEDMELSK